MLQKFRETQITKYYPDYYTNAFIKPDANTYKFGEEIQVYKSNYLYKYGKFLLPGPGPFGECKRSIPVKFMKNIEDTSCGLKLVK